MARCFPVDISGHWSSLSSMWKAEDMWGTCVPVPFSCSPPESGRNQESGLLDTHNTT